MNSPDEALGQFLFRLARDRGCDLKAAARYLLEHPSREIQYRREIFPEIAAATLADPLDIPRLKGILAKSKDSLMGGHGSTRGQVDAFLSSDGSEQLIRSLIPSSNVAPTADEISDFVRKAAELAFYNMVKGRKSYRVAESALFASILLTAVFPDRFVDFRQDRWTWAAKTFGFSDFPPRNDRHLGKHVVRTGELAQHIVGTPTFREHLSGQSDLWTCAGLIYLLCKDEPLRKLADMPTTAPASPPLSPSIHRAFERFRENPEHKLIVQLRHKRSKVLREVLASPNEMTLELFNTEIWNCCSSARAGDTDCKKWLATGQPLPDTVYTALSEAVDSDELEFHGNSMWGSGSRIYGPQFSDTQRFQNLQNALSHLNDPNTSPLEKTRRIETVPGFGPNVSTGLCMVCHPTEVAIKNGKSEDGLRKLGLHFATPDEFQEKVRDLKNGLGADDFIQLDWFLFLVSEGRISMVEPRLNRPTHLNSILYGPPGTGKTYAAIEMAVQICDGIVPPDRKEIVARYSDLCKTNRIVFVTFHQSYGYEEFIEGIRPVLKDGEADQDLSEGNVRYECRDGVFKKLCVLAKGTSSVDKQKYDFDQSQIRIWKMSLGEAKNPDDADIFDDCIQQGYILLGWGKGLDFRGCDTVAAVKEKLRSADSSMSDTDYNITSVNIFKNEMSIGDLVVVSDGNRKFRAIGKISSDYEFMPHARYKQKRSVQWLAVYEDSLPADTILKKAISQMTLYQLRPHVLKMDALKELLADRDESGPVNHVLIIDEINRGNISKILGELITLLEPDKRLGGENELIVKLPYSGSEFGVPSNVYVLGTMNTADRSIAFLDTALRRRFRFTELMPSSKVISRLVGRNGVIGRVNVCQLLDRLNDRIELLYDRDHQLGHSFFLQVGSLSDLRDVFRSHVLPLLQEYFYGDWEKISQIIGCPYDPETGKLTRRNTSPILLVRALNADGLDENDEGRFHYYENPNFVDGTDNELEPFFLELLSSGSRKSSEVEAFKE